jgi:hypothetical protein
LLESPLVIVTHRLRKSQATRSNDPVVLGGGRHVLRLTGFPINIYS